MPYSAIKVANRLLEIARARGQILDPLKLLKLVYISHGWSFPNFDRPLVRDRIEAWQYGPVVPALYHVVKQFKADPISTSVPGDRSLEPISPEDDTLLSAVFDSYGKYTGGQLSTLTHKPGTPWAITWAKSERNAEIPNELIASHYYALAGKQAT